MMPNRLCPCVCMWIVGGARERGRKSRSTKVEGGEDACLTSSGMLHTFC